MSKFIYDAERNLLVEEIEMEAPTRPLFQNYGQRHVSEYNSDLYHYNANKEIYLRHLMSRIKIPVSEELQVQGCRFYEEDKDFTICCTRQWSYKTPEKVIEGKEFKAYPLGWDLNHRYPDPKIRAEKHSETSKKFATL